MDHWRTLRAPWAAAAAAWVLACACGWAAGATPVVPTPTPTPPLAQGLSDIESTLRGRPEEAIAALDMLLPTTGGPAGNTTRVEALVLRGWFEVRVSDGAALERTARELELLPATAQPLGTTAAGLLRARWTARHGSLGRADRQLADVAARLPDNAPESVRLRLLDAWARVKQGLGKFDESARLYQQTVALADRMGPQWLRSEQRSSLAYTLYLAQQVDRAFEVNARALTLAHQSDDPLARSVALSIQGMVLGAMGRKTEELQAMRDAITMAHAAGATRDAVLCLANLADYYLRGNEPAQALKLAREALPMARQVRDTVSEAVALANAGLALIALHRRDEGVQAVRQALMLEERAGALTPMSIIQQELGLALEKSGHLKAAWNALLEHRRLADEVFQRDQQQALLELQEASDAERRQRGVAALQLEMKLKEAQLTGRELQHRLWAVGLLAGVLLLAAVGVLLHRMRRSNAQLRHSNAQLEVVSACDPLTALANRRHFHARMQQHGMHALEGSLLLIDIDHFKRINDRHGHAAGDAVLVEVTQRLRDMLRGEDLIVRWGGEEFLVWVREVPADQVEALAQRLLEGIAGRAVVQGRSAIAVTASIGFATFPLQPPHPAVGWERAVDLVDTAMYLAKAHGRNRAYGVRSLDAEGPSASLEQAWRNGRAHLTLLSGPPVAAEAAATGAAA